MALLSILLLTAVVSIEVSKAGAFSSSESPEETDRSKLFWSSGTRCVGNDVCYNSEKCVDNRCTHVCIGECLKSNELCFGTNHTKVCFCAPGYIYNSTKQCAESCTDSSQCNPFEVCHKEVGKSSACQCQHMFIRDRYDKTKCELSHACHDSNGCQSFERCVNGKCINACSRFNCTGPNKGCLALEHSVSCQCKRGYQIDSNGDCVSERCYEDDECGLNEKCVRTGYFGRCVCILEHKRDFTFHGICRLQCMMYSGWCPENFWCNGELCLPCDEHICNVTTV